MKKLFVLIIFILVCAPLWAQECLKARAAYDIGSGATKMMLATVDDCQHKIVEIISEDFVSVPFRNDLLISKNNQFSSRIQAFGIKTLQAAKQKMEQQYQAKGYVYPLQHCAVATAAFRKAANGKNVTQKMSEHTNIPVKIISQEDEGRLAYASAQALLDDPHLQAPVVWDIGGGSMQLTFKNPQGQWIILGNELAGSTFHGLVAKNILKKKIMQNPYPVSKAQVELAIELAKANLGFEAQTHNKIQTAIKQGTAVVAVGAPHAYVHSLCQQAAGKQRSFYTKEELRQSIDRYTDKTHEEISASANNVDPKFINNILSTMILVYATMDSMNINTVHVVTASNVQGMLLQGC